MTKSQRALAHLKRRIIAAAGSGSNRLPTITALARDAGVCRQTMFNAVATLKAAGLLQAHPRRGISLVPNAAIPDIATSAIPVSNIRLSSPGRSRTNDVRRRFMHDIAGKFFCGSDPRALPSVKQLTDRYGTCFQIMSEVLSALASEGIIERHKRRYRLAEVAPAARGSSVLLVSAQPIVINSATQSDQQTEFLRTLERECGRHGLGIIMVSADRLDSVLGRQKVRPAGVLIWPQGMPVSALEQLLFRLAPLRVPVALWEQTVLDPGILRLAAARRFLVCSSATDYEAGQAVGRYAANFGHSGITYFSPFHASIWCQHRLAGIRDALDAAGRLEDLRVFTLDNVGYDEIAAQLPAYPGYAAIERDMRSSYVALGRCFETTGRYLTDRMRADHLGLYLQGRLEPLFRNAFSTRHDSVWIGVNDFVVLRAMAWHGSMEDTTARPVNLVGFDDSVEAFAQGIPSFSFNMSALVGAMVGHVLGDKSVGARLRENRFKIPGELILRGS